MTRGKAMAPMALAVPLALALFGAAAGTAGSHTSSPATRAGGRGAIRQPVFTVYAAGQDGLAPGASPYAIVAGPQQSVWFTDTSNSAPAIGKITAAGQATEYPTPGSHPLSLVAGTDGNLWFTDAATGAIGRMTPAGAVTRFTQGLSAGDVPAGIVRAPSGLMWFVSGGAAPYVGHVDTNGTIVEVAHLSNAISADPSLGVDATGALWFTGLMNGNEYLTRVTAKGVRSHQTAMQSIRELCCPIRSTQTFAQNSDGTLWFSNIGYGNASLNNPTGRIDRAVISFYQPPAFVGGLTVGPGKRLWYAGQDPLFVHGSIGVINLDGTFSSFPTPSKTSPISITMGPDHNLWMSATGHSGMIIKATP